MREYFDRSLSMNSRRRFSLNLTHFRTRFQGASEFETVGRYPQPVNFCVFEINSMRLVNREFIVGPTSTSHSHTDYVKLLREPTLHRENRRMREPRLTFGRSQTASEDCHSRRPSFIDFARTESRTEIIEETVQSRCQSRSHHTSDPRMMKYSDQDFRAAEWYFGFTGYADMFSGSRGFQENVSRPEGRTLDMNRDTESATAIHRRR